MNFKKPITNLDQSKEFLTEFHQEYPGVHPEDDMTQVVDLTDKKYLRTFTDEQVLDLDHRLSEVYFRMEDPCYWILNNLWK